MKMLFRWSLWGKAVAENVQMLVDSIRSFRQVMGVTSEYVVFTEDQRTLSRYVGALAGIREFREVPDGSFNYFGTATWAKWCPQARLAPGDTEVHLDCDVFLLQQPTELLELAQSHANRYLVLQEFSGAFWQRGVFADCIPIETPFINAGFFVQGPRADISGALQAEFDWWRTKRGDRVETFHDEQGGLTKALLPALRMGCVDLLPVSRYKVISPRSNPDLSNLDGVVLFHATYPGHPAWQKFRGLLPS